MSNELSSTSPIPESVLRTEAHSVFSKSGEQINEGINALLQALSARSEFQNYKLFVSATKYGQVSSDPIKTYVGALWNSAQDGTTTVQLEELQLIVTLAWFKV